MPSNVRTSKIEKKTISEAVHETTQEQAVRPLDDVLGRAERAYSAYMGAKKEVANVYRENELHEESIYKAREQQAKSARDENIRRIFIDYGGASEQSKKVYEEALRRANLAYIKAKEQAIIIYRESEQEAENTCDNNIKQSVTDYRQTTEKFLREYEENVEQLREIYTKGRPDKKSYKPETIEDINSIMELSSSIDPVLGELWHNKKDAAYDKL